MNLSFGNKIIIVVLLLLIGRARVTPNENPLGEIHSDHQLNNAQIKHLLQSIQRHYAPDPSLAVFNVSFARVSAGIIVRGEVDNPEAKGAVIDALKKIMNGKVIDRIQVLPDSALESRRMGIIIPAVANVRQKPGKREALLTQALMGTVIKLLKKEHGYFFIQTPDHYLGWMDSASVFESNQTGIDAWDAANKVIVTEFFGVVYTRSDISSPHVCELVNGCILKSVSKKNKWFAVELPDGKVGFVPDTLVQDLGEWNNSRVLTGDNLEKTARSFLGIHYLWGGVSVKGMDCSGFVKTVYQLNGLDLLRDARQQARQGIPVDPGKNFQNLKKGDLLFFGQKVTMKRQQRITHVAMYLENGLFIHSSKKVRLNSFNASSNFYDEILLKRFIFARRILQN